MSVQMNVRVDEELSREVDELVRRGLFKTKREVVEEALRLLIARLKAQEIRRSIDEVREGTEELPSATEALLESRAEEDGSP
ncbi:MAG: ribbon-helix-helix domain-containing protein [Candidatus Korarchaeota archaeon]|nr:ribbon-helix-helix domain-containing protein [Candidatus Korarchaeota archaeon]